MFNCSISIYRIILNIVFNIKFPCILRKTISALTLEMYIKNIFRKLFIKTDICTHYVYLKTSKADYYLKSTTPIFNLSNSCKE